VALARLVPLKLAEEIYHADLCQDAGQPIVPARVALGALLVKERLGLTDHETVETIQENPYLQFFLGMEELSQERPFDASTDCSKPPRRCRSAGFLECSTKTCWSLARCFVSN